MMTRKSPRNVPFVLRLGMSRDGRIDNLDTLERRLALIRCTVIAQQHIACVPASEGQPFQLHLLPDGRAYYGGEKYDAFSIEALQSEDAASAVSEPVSRKKAKLPKAMRRTAGYLKWDGAYCYYCKQEGLQGDVLDMGGGKVWQKITCNCCGKSWTDVYSLTGVLEA